MTEEQLKAMIARTDEQRAPQPVDWNALREQHANPSADTAAVRAAIADHTAMSNADGLAALEAHQKAQAEREAERIERLRPPS